MNATHLKFIALFTMVIDHVGAIFFPQEPLFRIIGRIAFPVYCFLLVEGYIHTRNVKKYGLRLLLFAFISEVPFDYAFFGGMNTSHQNIFFTLFLGLLALHALESHFVTKPLLAMAGLVSALILSELLRTDYGILGILYVLTFYAARKLEGPGRVLLMVLLLSMLNLLLSGSLQFYSVMAVVFIAAYNGSPGIRSNLMKYGFYVSYPLHLLILYLLK